MKPGKKHYPITCRLLQKKSCSSKPLRKLIDLAHLTDSKSIDTLMEMNVKYHKDYGDPIPNPTLYQRLAGSLIYLTAACPDISYVVNLVSQFMIDPQHHHPAVVFRIV